MLRSPWLLSSALHRRIFALRPRPHELSKRVGGRCLSEVPSFRERLAQSAMKEVAVESFTERVKKPRIGWQIYYVVMSGLGIYLISAKAANVETAIWTERLKQSAVFQDKDPTSDDIKRAKYFHLGKRLQAMILEINNSVSNLPNTVKSMPILATARSMQNYLDASEARRVCWTIVLYNTCIFLAWKIPRARSFMNRAFTHDPLSGRSYTLFTSVFSHSSFWHLVLNSMALTSFTATAAQYFIREQRNSPTAMPEASVRQHLFAFYICSGLFASLFSHVAWTRIVYPRIVSRIASPTSPAKGLFRRAVTADTQINPSLGASGAIYASVVVTALAFPDAEISLFFPPGLTLPIQWGVGGFVLLDIIGILRGWRFFNHWAHLGGAIFGGLYYAWGPSWWDGVRQWDMSALGNISYRGDDSALRKEIALGVKQLAKEEEEWDRIIAANSHKKPRPG
ncbi:hypothetical protein OE88DRAFT_1807883 [Heliocybe sulcata]|uniref:Peptidase S54 rhomboid domain-containing protein n=1 Tax=Heliocybe sulcata TaxID=5364 RepID=A0A5C3N7G3_9AGAM|nr:hypothetical protein OE88DRAFT_1807883 [Heliocybe sulcata]